MSVESSCPVRAFLHDAADASRIERPRGLAGRVGIFTFGLVAYLGFFLTFIYAIGFIGNWIVPKSIDGGAAGPVVPSLLINAGLLMLFVVQHTIMARPAFKRWWTRIVPASMERSVFVAATVVCLGLLFWQWRPLPQVIWRVEGVGGALLTALCLSGWGIALLSSCLVSHFDLFGLRQVWMRLRDVPYRPVGFRLRGLYRLVRHPLMLGFLIAFWATPVMTLGHLFFAVMTTLYIRMGTWFEERDLIAEHGEEYLEYQRSVPGILPVPRGGRALISRSPIGR
jgi:protein-S-isoprenylcysteine O-methyltransferase Ste14